MNSKEVRIGVIGVGGIGSFHVDYLSKDRVPRCRLAALCDINPAQMAAHSGIPKYTDSAAMIRSGKVDAVIIATPHYDHTPIAIDAFRNGIHVLVEKPVAVHKADAQRMIAAHRKNRRLVFTAMFMMRTSAYYIKLRELVRSGELGKIQRVNWIITEWFRTNRYYASGDWRATWRGEGGGVLMNQCPHNLDLWQWILGMPKTVRAFCGLGKHHPIEVEDEVTAYMEYPNGATGVFITTTGEAPGTNRWEIAGDKGKVVCEEGKLSFTRNEVPASKFRKTSKESFAMPGRWHIEIPTKGGGAHDAITRNFVEAILDHAPLIAPAEEGINQVELTNAMIYSSLEDKTVALPLDARAYERKLRALCAKSRYRKPPVIAARGDITSSFR